MAQLDCETCNNPFICQLFNVEILLKFLQNLMFDEHLVSASRKCSRLLNLLEGRNIVSWYVRRTTEGSTPPVKSLSKSIYQSQPNHLGKAPLSIIILVTSEQNCETQTSVLHR